MEVFSMRGKKSVCLCALVCLLANLPSANAADEAAPVPKAPGKPVSSSFLGPLWQLVAPAGGSASISDGHLFLGVPGGSNHDTLLPNNQAVRVVQPIGNKDFDVSIKIDSILVGTEANTSQGIIALSSNEEFVTFALATDGSTIGVTLSAHVVTDGVATTVVVGDADFSAYQNRMYLRLKRTGNSYKAFYSFDGVSWVQASGFKDNKVPTSIGLFASNYNRIPADALPVVMSVNSFNSR
jgi:hypothetical protein